MKNLFLLLPVFLLILLSGCTTVKETIYLQSVQTTGPINPPPLNITNNIETGDFTFSTSFSMNDNKTMTGVAESHSMVNQNGVFQVDTVQNGNIISYKDSGQNKYKYTGQNLEWNMPNFALSFNADYCVSNHVAISAGINFTNQYNVSLMGGSAAIGFYSSKPSGGTRLSLGVTWQQMSYHVNSAVLTEYNPPFKASYNVVTFYDDDKKTISWNPFVLFTYNTAMEKFPLNFFFNAGVFGQTIVDFNPSTTNVQYYPSGAPPENPSANGTVTATFFTLGTGAFFRISDVARIIFGMRFYNETKLQGSPHNFMMPVIQLDMLL